MNNASKVFIGVILIIASPFYGHWLNSTLGFTKDDEIIGALEGSLFTVAGIALIVWAVADALNKK